MIICGFTKRYERHGIFNLEEILPRIGGTIQVPGYGLLSLKAHRYLVFRENIICVSCKAEGLYFALERSVRKRAYQVKGEAGHRYRYTSCPDSEWHFNLYTLLEDGKELLMNHDHIIPRSKGGRNEMWNYQTMCEKCNSRKGNAIPLPASSLFLTASAGT